MQNRIRAGLSRNVHAGFQPAWPASRMQHACWACLFLYLRGYQGVATKHPWHATS
ncbi:MAG: hypothetical protein Q7U12_06245 [Undibacterium sp.]|nr:hypothetical protein [Undibacterium sp.]